MLSGYYNYIFCIFDITCVSVIAEFCGCPSYHMCICVWKDMRVWKVSVMAVQGLVGGHVLHASLHHSWPQCAHWQGTFGGVNHFILWPSYFFSWHLWFRQMFNLVGSQNDECNSMVRISDPNVIHPILIKIIIKGVKINKQTERLPDYKTNAFSLYFFWLIWTSGRFTGVKNAPERNLFISWSDKNILIISGEKCFFNL